MGTTQKIAICLPTNRGLKPKCLQSLLEIVSKQGSYEIFVSTEGFTTAENRTWLAVKAVKSGATHILWVDDDMIYAPDTLERLLSHDKDIVGAKYHVRREVLEGNPDVIGYLNPEDKDRTDLFECESLGGGCVLTKTEVFKKIPQPWFSYEFDQNGMVTTSHDWFFSRKARANGYTLWCDGSLYPGHIALKEW